MKRCPVCEKTYGYESLRFCRFDGARLEDVSWREAPTILLKPHEIPQSSGGLKIDTATGELKIYPFS
jgi:hypothetical protein